MRRNISSELIVALLAAVSLLFAAVFAVLLSTSTSQRTSSQPTVATVEVSTSTVTALAVDPANVTETPVPEDVTHAPVESETPMRQPIAATDRAPAAAATTDQAVARTPTIAVATELPLATQTSATQTEIAFAPATTTAAAMASATPSSTDILPTATLDEVATHIAPANLTLTAIRETVVALEERSTERADATLEPPGVDRTKTPIARETVADATETPEPSATDSLPTASLEEVATHIAPANLTLTAIRETVVALEERSTARVDATETPLATETAAADATETREPATTDSLPTATLDEVATHIAPANLTLTAIRETVVALGERSTARADATEIPEPSATDSLPTATLDEMATRIAPANLTLTAMRETVVALVARPTARAVATAESKPVEATETPLSTEIVAADATEIPEPSATDSLPTATLDEMATRIAPANLTLTAIREAVVALEERSTVRADATAELTAVDATETPRKTETATVDATEIPAPSPTDALPTATLEEAEPPIAPANLTLTAIRETVVALEERSTARVDATETPLATETEADGTGTPETSATDSLPTATLEEVATHIAPANLTLTAIRETVVALEERSTERAEATAESKPVDATETPLSTEIVSADATETPERLATDSLPTATFDEMETLIAPANLTLTAIRETVVALGERSTARADATEIPEPSATDALPTATLEEVATHIAPANLTLTAIRETVVALKERSTERADATAELTAVDATETPLATEIVSADATETPERLATDSLPTATFDEMETLIAPANLTLTAIRETVVALEERSTERADATLEPKPVDVTETPLATETAAADATEIPAPSPTDSLPTATLDEMATRIAPANLTLTAIRETVVALGERSTARADATEIPEPSATDSLPIATLEEVATHIAPANLTLTAIRETVVEMGIRSTERADATLESKPVDETETPLVTETAAADATAILAPSATDSLPTATLDEMATRIAPANLTLTAIRETVVALEERSTERADATLESKPVDVTETPLATEIMSADATETTEPSATDSLPTATLDEAATRIAPANLTLTAIRETVVALEERSTERTKATAESKPVDATATPLATETAATATETPKPSPAEVTPTATLEEAATHIAPANLTLTAIRETVVALVARSTARAGATAESKPVDATETPLATETEADGTGTPETSATDSLPTATLDEAATRIAPANLTLTAIRETVVALEERSTARADATADSTAVDTTETPMATEIVSADATETPERLATDSLPTATFDEMETRIAPANLTLTAMRETVVARGERSTARADATADSTAVDATETPLATEIVAADATEIPVPSATDALPTATLDEMETRIAPANLTLTAIREAVVALEERSTVRADATAELTAVDVTETPLATEIVAADATEIPEPSATDSLPTATLEEVATRIAPANLTLTAIREAVVALEERSTERAEATAEPTAVDATETPLSTEIVAADATEIPEPSPTEVMLTATLEEVATHIAPANLTLTAIRETVVALEERSKARADATADSTAADATETPLATEIVAADATEIPEPKPTDSLPTATLEEAATHIAPANLTLTAIRETVDALVARSTARAVATADSKPVDATETPLSTEIVAADATEIPEPKPTDSLPTATLEEVATHIAPANLTLTAIRETVVAVAERSTARAEATAEPTAVDVTETPLTTETAAADVTEASEPSATDALPTATLEEVATHIAPANLTLTAIRETVVALEERSTERADATADSTAVDATETPLSTEIMSADATEIPAPSPADSLPTATLEEVATQIAPANLTLTAIRETVVALAERSAERADATAESKPVDATETPLATEIVSADATETPETSATDSLPTATLDEAATRIAPANLMLTAIRETVVALEERSTERADATLESKPVDETETPLATETAAADATEIPAPSATDSLPTATLEEVATHIAPANLTLTAIRETVVALEERSTVRADATAEPTTVDVTEAPHATETAAADATETPEPAATDSLPTATLDEMATRIAPANLTLTAIRETVVALEERSTVRADATAEPKPVDATETPIARETAADAPETPEPSATDSLPTATLDEAATQIAPANLTLTAIRETVVALGERSTARAEATEIAERSATDSLPTATLDEAATHIAPANLTLTAIRETVAALAAQSTARAEATAEPTAVDVTETPLTTETAAADVTEASEPSPTDSLPTATLDEAATRIAPANLTLTAIRETVVALKERSTERADATAELTAVDVTEPALATVAAPPVSTEIATPISTDAAIAETARPDPQISASMTASATLKPSGTASRSAARTPTVTPLPFHFAQLIPTPTDVESVAIQQLPACEVQQGWQTYKVQAGDTLLSLALATGSSLIELRDGNCFEPIRGIFAGQRLLVPRLPVDRIVRPAPVYPQVDEATDVTGCDQPTARISAPEPLASLKGVFAMRGTVQLPERGSYQIALRPAWADNYYLYLSSNKPIRGDVIALINTEVFGPGLHRIQLKVTSRDGGTIEGGLCDIPVVFVAP